MDPFSSSNNPLFDSQIFNGVVQTAGASWATWTKPRGKSMCSIFLLGGGGGGGSGTIGAAAAAAGGGGGGSAGQTILEIPLILLPDYLYVSVAAPKTGAGIASYVATQPQIATNQHILAVANGGGAGGNGSGGIAGAAGAAGAIATNATMPLGWAWSMLALAGQAGIIGATNVAGGALTLPTTGLRVTGGTGGGGLPAGSGNNGGAITGIASPSYFQGLAGGVGAAGTTTPGGNGNTSPKVMEAGFFYYGGTGGGSTNGTATGAGLVQGAGGNGGIGSGGGGGGGALTASTAAPLSYGGAGICIITCY